MSINDIRQKIRGNRQKLRAFGVNKIGFFGSFARGEQRPESDVDLVVFFDSEKLSFDSYMNVTFFLEDLLKTNVDVLTPDQISPHIMPYIQKDIEYESL